MSQFSLEIFITVDKTTILHPQYLLQVLEKTIWQVTHFIALHEPANLNVLSVKGNRERPKEFPHVNYKITIIIANVMDIAVLALSYWLFKLPISFAIYILAK